MTNHGWVLGACEISGLPRRYESRTRWSFPVVASETPKALQFIGHRLVPKPRPIAYPLLPL